MKTIDLRENQIPRFFSFPKSARLETVLLSFNVLTDIGGFGSAPNIVTLDLKNNKLKSLSDEIFLLKNMKILDLSNNDLEQLPPELGIMKLLSKLQIEGNPLRGIRLAIRQGGTEMIKKYLSSRITEETIQSKVGQPGQGGGNSGTGEKGQAGGHSEGAKTKGDLIREEFGDSRSTQISKIVGLIRQMKTPNGELDLKGKGLTDDDFESDDILKADRVKCIDLTNNKLTNIPAKIAQLSPLIVRISSNQIPVVRTDDFIHFNGIKEFEMKSCKLQAFCPDFASMPQNQLTLLQMNFDNLSHLDLSQNGLQTIPPIIREFRNLRTLMLGYNGIKTLDDLFLEGSVPLLDVLDMSNNALTEVPQKIYRWQSITSLILQNNNIKQFPPEIGFMGNIKNINITGNPSMLIKNNVANKGAAYLLNYLKDRCADKNIEKEVTAILQNNQNRASQLPPKRPNDLVEYEFKDPFKQRTGDYNAKQDNKYGEVYEEDLRKKLSETKGKGGQTPIKSQRMDEEPPVSNKMDEEPIRAPQNALGRAQRMDIEEPPSAQQNRKLPGKSSPFEQSAPPQPQQPQPNYGRGRGNQQSSGWSLYGDPQQPQQSQAATPNKPQKKTEEFENYSYNTKTKAPTRSNPFATDNDIQPQAASQSKRPQQEVQAPPPQQPQQQQQPSAGAEELDKKIKLLQDKVDNDYTLSKVKIAELKKELTQLRVQRNQLNAK